MIDTHVEKTEWFKKSAGPVGPGVLIYKPFMMIMITP